MVSIYVYEFRLIFKASFLSILGGSLVKKAWPVLRLRMEGSPKGREGNCEYIE
jgi:hypothetical protein